MEEHELWTFEVRGGSPFGIQAPGNPTVHHNGVLSVFHLMLTEGQAVQVEKVCQSQQCDVVSRPAAGQTEEQHEERLRLLGVGQEEKVWPSASCPECFWFDPLTHNPCGYQSWNPVGVETSLAEHEKARKDVESCPMGVGE